MKTIGLLLALFVSLIGCNNSRGQTLSNQGDLISAVALYYGDHTNHWPESLDALIPRYMSSIPNEEITKSNKVVTVFDGSGGWFYNPANGEVKANLNGFK